MVVVSLKDVHFEYTQNAPILKGLSLDVLKGEFLAIIGKNASGKSTLARLINGLISPLSGNITVLGMDLSDSKNLFEVRKNVGIVFQNPDNQMVASIVEDDVVFGPENIGISPSEIENRLNFALKETGTEPFKKQMASRLSGGQKQRVAIAGVLAIKPQILILDESTSMLDPRGRKEVMDVVKRLNKEENMTVITITHYMDEVIECDRVALLDDGVIKKIDTPKNIFQDTNLLYSAGMEQPIPAKICNLLNSYGVKIDTHLDKESLALNLIEIIKNGQY